jgi:hypothetical protein
MPVVRPTIGGQHQPSEVWFFLLWPIQPWFLTEEKLAVVLFIPSSSGFPTPSPSPHASSTFLAPLPGRKEDFYKGSLSHSSSLFCLILALFYFTLFCLHLLIKNYKKNYLACILNSKITNKICSNFYLALILINGKH